MSEINRGEVRERIGRELLNAHTTFEALLDGIMAIVDEIVEELESRGEDEDDRGLDEVLNDHTQRSALECGEDVALTEWFDTTARES